ncbi:putative HECT-type ubiquitin ligase-interacting protein cred [Chaetomidium leptoderma]|uniref:HECT-type ubiquitin ligase-interacting protein cred n=1 Tax=Chaetomidium leptoderma TaxID=669021 RepID=A0AAN6VI01_9PEZI|nr:putative HECT-type ubiquitin ligase-interacting protein cred [Chaetomidium leptoderma]
MWSRNPFSSGSGKPTLFEIRLENDFIVFQGSDHEASGQLLKGTVVLCLSSPLKVEDIHLKLMGTAHYAWTDAKVTATGISTHKVDKTVSILDHRWPPFAGIGAADPTDSSRQQNKGVTLAPGNYEWPFELLLGGDTTESVEGLREASVRYKLKATLARGKLSHDRHAYKQLRVIRTLGASALETLHSMSIENLWPNKIDYSVVVPQKAVVFGSCIPMEMRFTPLLKGLEVGDIKVKLIEIHDIILQPTTGHTAREHKKERDIDSWTIPVSREEHWQDVILEGAPDGWEGQEGWVVNTSLTLPKKLTKCLQDVNANGIKIRHKLKLVVALNNPDGHVSELRATLPVSIFISPNMPLDEQGNLVRQLPNGASREAAAMTAPPAYEHHRLDQLYDDIDPSGVSSPFPSHSRAGSTENIPALLQGAEIPPDLLARRLHSMSLEQRHRNTSWNSNLSAAGVGSRTADSPPHPGDESQSSPTQPSGSNTPPEHLDYPKISELSKVPSYQTAVKTPVRTLASDRFALPDYQTAVSAPSSRPGTPRLTAAMPSIVDSLETMAALTQNSATTAPAAGPTSAPASGSASALRKDKRKSTDMATTPQATAAPPRQETMTSIASDEAVPDTDPSTTAGLLAQRLQAWKHAVVYLEEYMEAVEKIHKAQAKEYERVLKTISKPLREGQHFDQSLGGVAGFFENMRVNTQALVNTNLETEKNIRGSALPVVERLHKEIKHKAKELAHGAEKGAKEVDKARNTTQKHIELLGQHTASFEATGGKQNPSDDPYVISRGVVHRLSKQVLEENNQHNDLVAVQTNFEAFERHIIQVVHQAMETFTNLTGGQALKVQALHADMLGAAQRIPPNFEWKAFLTRSGDALADPNQAPRAVEAIQFPNMAHPSTKPLIEGALERKSRNKLSWGYSTSYYVVTPSKFLHEFKDGDDNLRHDPVPQLSLFLPDAVIGAPSGVKFNVKGKDRSGSMGGKLAGSTELAFKAHSPAEAEKWFAVIRGVVGATGPAVASGSTPSPAASEKPKPVVAVPAQQQQQESGVMVTGGEAVASPTVASPTVASPTVASSVEKKGSVDVPAPAPAPAAAEKAADVKV